MKKLVSILLSVVMVLTLTVSALAEVPTFDGFELGKDYTDLTASIKILTHRTDLAESGAFANYVAEFNKVYPNIAVAYEAITDYSKDSLLRLTGSSDWGDIMMMPVVEADEMQNYFVSFGKLEDMKEKYNFIDGKAYNGLVYGIPSTGNANGVVYNKAVFEKAGITELPKTPDEFIAALQKIKDNTDAIPLYTNYAAGWTMGAWDAYIGGSATGDADYMNHGILHQKDPFADRGNGSGPYAVYKILYDVVAKGLIEEDYTTTDWETSKGMINNGQIGCMVLGSWAFSQMRDAGEHGEDIGYMSFPISVNGKQYASAGGDYNYAINKNADETNQIASMVYIKWLTYESGFSYNEGGIPINKDGKYPELYEAFDGIELVVDLPAHDGEELLPDDMNVESGLGLSRGQNEKVQKIVEAAFSGTKTIDEIMASWNEAWTDAQEALNVTVE